MADPFFYPARPRTAPTGTASEVRSCATNWCSSEGTDPEMQEALGVSQFLGLMGDEERKDDNALDTSAAREQMRKVIEKLNG